MNPSGTIMTGIARFRAYCKKKILSDNTVRTYNSFINNFIFWIEENGYTNMVAAEITEWTIEEFLDQ
jgi:site-specific recombinase XerD